MKYELVLQHSEEDCGAACLATIAKHYGRNFTLTRTREAVGTGQLGTTLLGLRRGTHTLGFYARSVKASPEIFDKLKEIPLPAIIHWKGYHWVVLYGQRGNKYVIADPAMGICYLSQPEMIEGWKDWVMLLLEPDPSRFFAQSDDKISSLGKFLIRLWFYRNILFEALLCAITVGLLSLASPFFIQILTDDVLVRGDFQLLTGVLFAIAVMYLLRSGLTLVENNLIAHFAQRLELGLILEFGYQILQLPLTYYETRRSGEISSRLRDIQQINRLISRAIVSLPTQFFIAAISLCLMLFYSWKLMLVAIFVAALMSLSTLILQPILERKTQKTMALEAENQAVLVETFKGALTLKTITAAPQFWDELQSRFGRLAHLMFVTVQIGIVNKAFSRLVSDLGDVALLGFGGMLVISKELSIGQILAFASLNRNVAYLIGDIVDFIEDFTLIKTANLRLQEVITATPETQNDEKKPFAEIAGNADIICTNLNFHYPGRLELLENFSLTIPGGKVTAVIGKSGCGKSTLAKLIASLYTLQSGNIRIGKYNLQDLSLDYLRQQIVLIPQEAHFWSRSIIENFCLGSPHLTFEEIVDACEIAGADEFIRKLPEKYQTILGEFGADLSGGQRQRLAIARAIAKDPPVIILDESTGGLDPVSEEEVLDRLLSHRQGKTTILISHRPRVIARADWIVFLEAGKLQMQGYIEDIQHQSGIHLKFLFP
ncbi:MAG: peptidase domain-containing ABC transporter [Cyanosarcina radialis HA8281-LM2]|jgi:ATP-binding cassette subfamily C protein|nr:peptidase domain-containing ABC transporter [Cyanosarcina radialis HA8281-LM2]